MRVCSLPPLSEVGILGRGHEGILRAVPTSRSPIPTQIGGRLGVTFAIVDVVADVFRPVHVSVERRITLLAHVQAAFDTLTIVFSTAHATRLTRITL